MSSFKKALVSIVNSSPLQESRSSGLGSFFPFFGGDATSTTVNNNTALTIPAYFNGLNQIAGDIAKLPKGVFQKVDGEGTAVNHKVKYLLNKEPNNLMTAYDFHFIMAFAAMHRGNAVAYIVRNKNTAEIDSLIFIHPDDLHNIFLSNGKLYYKTKFGLFTEEEVVHIKGFTDNGLIGKSLITYAAETLGIAKSAQSFTSHNYKSRGLGFGWVSTDKSLDPGPKRVIETAINEKLSAEGKVKTVMLDEGMEYHPITMNMQEAQLIEQGKFSIADIARILNISTRKLKDSESDNYASAYQDAVDHLNDCLMPWIKRFEQEYGRKLFSPSEKLDHYVKLNDNLLLRGDLTAKGAFYNQAIFSGWMSRDEVRQLEELNTVGGVLAEYLTPVNTQTPEQIQKNLNDEQSK